MKTLVLSAMMGLAAMTSTAQVITADIVNISYQSVATSNEGQYAYNVNCDDNDYITTMYVFKKNVRMNGDVDLKPSCQYQYEYADDGILLSRTTFSRWNPNTACFDEASEMMTYSLLPNYTAFNISWFLRSRRSDSYKLSWQVYVTDQPSFEPNLLAEM